MLAARGCLVFFFFLLRGPDSSHLPGEGRSTTHSQLSPGCFPALACPRTPGTSPRARSVLGMRALIKGSKGIGKKERHGKNRLLPDIKRGRQGGKTSPRSCHLSTGGGRESSNRPSTSSSLAQEVTAQTFAAGHAASSPEHARPVHLSWHQHACRATGHSPMSLSPSAGRAGGCVPTVGTGFGAPCPCPAGRRGQMLHTGVLISF